MDNISKQQDASWESEQAGERVDRASGPPPAAVDGSMAYSVTRHADFSGPTSCRRLAAGVDTLDLALGIEWGDGWPALLASLEKSKSDAAGSKGIPWFNDAWLIRPGGKPPMYRFHLQQARFNLFLGISPTGDNAYASLNSELLWHEGLEGSLRTLVAAVDQLGGRVRKVLPSRCDACADFLIPDGLTLEFLRAHRVPARSHIRLDEKGPSLQSFYVGGRKCPIQLRIYNKSAELESHGNKQWFWLIWNLEPGPNVWRIEFQLRRPVLKQFRIDRLGQLADRLAGLWKYLTERWVSFRLHDNANATRRTVHPWWQIVVSAADALSGCVSVKREYVPASMPFQWYLSHVAGCLAGYAVARGTADLGVNVDDMMQGIRRYWARRDFPEAYRTRCIRMGIDPDARTAP